MVDWGDGWNLVGLFEFKQNAAASRKLPDTFFDPDRILFQPQMFPRLCVSQTPSPFIDNLSSSAIQSCARWLTLYTEVSRRLP